MNKEIEAKFVRVDHDQIRALLTELGAVCEHPLELMRRVVYHRDDDSKDAYFRVRDEGYRVTMTYKEFHGDTIDSVSEIETVVRDYDATVAILDKTDLLRETYQETRRETWRLGAVEIMLDEWPWVDPFVEIEGPDEAQVRDVSERLGFDWGDALFGGVAKAYMAQYTNMGDAENAAFIINRRIPEMKFGMPVPDVLK